MRPAAVTLTALLVVSALPGPVFGVQGAGARAGADGRVVGRVVDIQTLGPVPSALVGLDEGSFQASTDAEGRFVLEDVPPGERTLVVRHVAYGRQIRQLTVPAGGTVTVLLRLSPEAIPLDPIRVRARRGVDVPRHWARIVGRTLHGESNRKGVENAAITFRPLGHQALSDDDGRFALALPPGTYAVEVSHLAYGRETTTVRVPPARTLELTLRLSPDVIELEPLFVEVTARSRYLERHGFYERRARGWGYFFDPEFFERTPLASGRGNAWLGQLASRVPHGGSRLRRYCAAARRGPTIYVDGSKARPPDINVAEVAAVEWYPSPSQTAPEFIDSDSQCGVIVIWLKRGP